MTLFDESADIMLGEDNPLSQLVTYHPPEGETITLRGVFSEMNPPRLQDDAKGTHSKLLARLELPLTHNGSALTIPVGAVPAAKFTINSTTWLVTSIQRSQALQMIELERTAWNSVKRSQ